MATLIDRAKEIRDAIRHCTNSEGISGCRQCYYYTNGCRYSLMLVSARIIDRLMQELKDAVPTEHGQWIERKSFHAEGGIVAKCSACQKDVQYLGNPLKYCPNCGARMDGGDGYSEIAFNSCR